MRRMRSSRRAGSPGRSRLQKVGALRRSASHQHARDAHAHWASVPAPSPDGAGWPVAALGSGCDRRCPARRPASRRRLRLRGRALGGDGAGAARGRGGALRPDRRGHRLRAVAAHRGGSFAVLGRAEQGQEVPGRQPAGSGRPRAAHRTDRYGRDLSHQLPGPGLDGPRQADRSAGRSGDGGRHRQPRRDHRGGLHGQRGDRLPHGDRPCGSRRSGQQRAAGLGSAVRADGRRRDPGRRATPGC